LVVGEQLLRQPPHATRQPHRCQRRHEEHGQLDQDQHGRAHDDSYTGEEPAAAAQAHDLERAVVKLPEAKQVFVLLPKRWVVERDFAWAPRFRRLTRDYKEMVQPGNAFRRGSTPA